MIFISFQDSAGNLDPNNLSLSDLQKYEVVNKVPHYRQYIRHHASKLMLATPKFHAQELVLKQQGAQLSALVPVGPWLRHQLNIVEQYACHHVSIPVSVAGNKQPGRLYKPLYQQANMYISISQWCNCLKLNRESGTYNSTNMSEMKGKGVYGLTVEVPYIYIGEHRSGEAFSLTLRIVEIIFEPDMEQASPSLVQIVGPPPPAAVPMERKGGRKRDVKQPPAAHEMAAPVSY